MRWFGVSPNFSRWGPVDPRLSDGIVQNRAASCLSLPSYGTSPWGIYPVYAGVLSNRMFLAPSSQVESPDACSLGDGSSRKS